MSEPGNTENERLSPIDPWEIIEQEGTRKKEPVPSSDQQRWVIS